MRIAKSGATVIALSVGCMLASSSPAQVTSYREIEYPPLPSFKIEKPQSFKLDNGMTVFLMEDHELPLIRVVARIRTGSNYDPPDKTGLADIFAQTLREGGTSGMTGDRIDDFLAARDASIETGMTGDYGTASLNCLKEDFDDVLAVFRDILIEPVFAEDKLELARVQANTAIARRNDSISALTEREFKRLIYGTDSPLARLEEYSTVAAITRDDLVAWLKKYYHPGTVYLGVVGDFDSASMRAKIGKAFGSWPKGSSLVLPDVPYAKEERPVTAFIEKDDVTQAYVRLGHLGIRVDNPDYFATAVMNEVLGGSFASRLFSNVRSKKGLAYSVSGGLGSSHLRPGIFQVGLSTKSSTMAQAVEALRAEVRGIIDDPPTDAEIRRAKESILNSFIFNYDSNAKILSQQIEYAYYGLPADFLERYRDNIEKVTREQVAAVARKHLHPEKMKLLIVGKSADFDKPVEALGTVARLDVAIPAMPDVRPKVEKTAASLEAGAQLFARMARALTDEATERVGSANAAYTVAVQMGDQSMSLNQVVSFVLPDKVRQTMKTPMGDQVLVTNGVSGFMSARGRTEPLPKEVAEDSLRALGRDLLVLSGNAGNPELQAVAAGAEDVDGLRCNVLEVTFMGSESRLFVAPNGKVVKQTFRDKHPFERRPGLMEVRYSDYESMQGRLIPRTRVLSFEGQELLRVRLDSIQVNPTLDDAQFEVPAGG